MSNIPIEDVALAAEKLSDDEITLAVYAALRQTNMNFPEPMRERIKQIEDRLKRTLPLRRRLEANPETARELVSDYPVYASTSGLTYGNMIEICVALELDDVDYNDYAHCASCDKIINLDSDKWYADSNNTYCEEHKEERDKDE